MERAEGEEKKKGGNVMHCDIEGGRGGGGRWNREQRETDSKYI